MSIVSLAAAPTRVTLRDPEGRAVGIVTLKAVKEGVRVAVSLFNMTPGVHALHVHAVGVCQGPEFISSGDHFNPGGREHGLENVKGPHAGDLPNVSVSAEGSGTASFLLSGATLTPGVGSLFPSSGTSLVLHAGPDDHHSDPAGNSGGRVACGVVQRTP